MEYLDLTPPALRKELLCITTTRLAGDLRTLANRAEICRRLNIPPKSLTCGQQVHKNHIALVRKSQIGKTIPRTDALLTSLSGVPLAIFTADCLPIFIYAPLRSKWDDTAVVPYVGTNRRVCPSIIGLVHAGRQGTQLKILEKTLKFILQLMESGPPSIMLVFGPCICKKCYPVSSENLRGYDFDLRGENRKQALRLGIKRENIYISTLCTACHPKLFFSYHKTHTSARMMNVVMMKK